MTDLFASIEQSLLSLWMREDPYAYFVALILHAFGMALLVGSGIVLCLRAMGVGREAAAVKFRPFFSVLWVGAALAVVSGVLLLWAYPAKALTNPLFPLKLVLLAGAVVLTRRLATESVGGRRGRRWAAVALLMWLAGVAAGKLLLHTYSVLTVS